MPESNEAGRASGVINTAASVAMAREKARVLGPKVTLPSGDSKMAPNLWTMDLVSRWIPLIAGLPPPLVSAVPPITIPRFQMMQPRMVRWRRFVAGETRALAEVK